MNRRNGAPTRLVRVGLLAATLVLGASAVAAENIQTRSIAVRYDDLNLANTAGAEKLYGRIRRAARLVCSTPGRTYMASTDAARRKCRQDAIEAAVKSVDNKVLTAMHQQKVVRRYG